MKNKNTTGSIAGKLWFFTWLTFSAGTSALILWESGTENVVFLIPVSGVALIGSLPAFLVLTWSFRWINNYKLSQSEKFLRLLFIQLLACTAYGSLAYIINGPNVLNSLQAAGITTAALFACNCVSVLLNLNPLKICFTDNSVIDETTSVQEEQAQPLYNLSQNQNTTQMENNPQPPEINLYESKSSNKIMIKGAITGALILLMLIPTVFITNLVQEREQRQKEVVAEVSNKWAKAQTITGPYIIVPYNQAVTDTANKKVTIRKSVVLLPENLNVNGDVIAQQSHRSIYNVLLYKSNLTAKGNFAIKLPPDIIQENLLLNEAHICVGLNDFKGIEGKVAVTFNGTSYDLSAGLPSDIIDSVGLSAPVPLTVDDFKKDIPFTFQLHLKGSEQLRFVPLAGNSQFSLQSTWPSPSFDGNTLPSERNVSEKGFTAKWNFNKANLPFNTASKDFNIAKDTYAFGVTMLQPADQYVKTMRSVKYAILFIGLTFSLFFIVELMQKKPVHPVQYVLVGLALVIFYSLLLSFSEYIMFDYAYLIAALATVTLITLYAKSHFVTWKVASVFGGVLLALYTFIFVLISLEDTALLVGSIGLFAVLALVMYASRKINWYHPTLNAEVETV